MNAAAGQPTSEPLPERQRAALLNLLGDDDDRTYQAIRKRLIAFGPAAETWLRPLLVSNDPVVRRHARDILDYQERQRIDASFLAFCESAPEQLDLESATLQLSRTRHPSARP